VAVQEANIARQENDIAMQRVQLANDQRLLERDQAQLAKGLSTKQSVEKAELAVKTRKAQITSAEKAKIQAEAQLAQAKLNVSYCTIRSPVDGVVVNRMVDVGQALQSRVNAPTLF
jgi:HlyD family secretion protein